MRPCLEGIYLGCEHMDVLSPSRTLADGAPNRCSGQMGPAQRLPVCPPQMGWRHIPRLA